MKDYIARAMKRCETYEIENDLVFSKKIIEGEELRTRIMANKNLMVTAEPYMHQLYNFVRGSNFFAILTDHEGCILSVIGDDDILKEAYRFKMIPGAFMDEKNIGTNAMGTALVEGVPIQISGEEHYISAYYRWTCSGTVIRDEEGNIIGTLDLTGYIENVHPHTLGMVVAAVNAIENTMKLKASHQILRENAKFTNSLLDSIQAAIIACDVKGTIKAVNQQSVQLFGYTKEEFLGKPVHGFVARFDEIISCCRVGIDFQNEDVEVVARTNMAHLNLSAYPVKNDDNEVGDVILVLKDVKKVRKMANEIMGRKAIYTFDKIIGQSKGIKDVIGFGKQVADSKSTVLLTGESGTGKEIFAHAIHNHSRRSKENFVVLNCASIPRNLIESELFGYEEGSFTGAKRGGHPGKFEIADGGTIFLDEIGEMPLDMQTRLLRVIQEGIVCRVGGSAQMPVDVRIIAATNKDLYEEVEKGNFRLDLFYRLKVLPIHLPPLRSRKDDIPMLVAYFENKISKSLNKKAIHLPEDYLNQLLAYSWPGNVRELENIIELMINTGKLPELTVNEKPLGNADAGGLIMGLEYEGNLEDLEKIMIERVLKKSGFNISSTAKVLGIGRNTLYRKMERYDITCAETER